MIPVLSVSGDVMLPATDWSQSTSRLGFFQQKNTENLSLLMVSVQFGVRVPVITHGLSTV